MLMTYTTILIICNNFTFKTLVPIEIYNIYTIVFRIINSTMLHKLKI